MTLEASSLSDGFRAYVARAREIPLLEAEEEADLARRWRDHADKDAADRLVESHLRLVLKAAAGFAGYGIPLMDLVAEGNLGLIKALKRYDPERDLRFATYALYWVRAAIMDYVLKNAAPVSVGLSAERKRLFFKLRGAKARRQGTAGGAMSEPARRQVAQDLGVSAQAVAEMEALLSGPARSMDEPVGEEGIPFGERMVDPGPDPETLAMAGQERRQRRSLFRKAWTGLTERERAIVAGRRLTETPAKLEELGRRWGISSERVRQIEMAALKKLKRLMGVGETAVESL